MRERGKHRGGKPQGRATQIVADLGRSRGECPRRPIDEKWVVSLVLRAYARFAGLALVSLGLAGFIGVLGWDPLASFYHLCVGLFFAYAGFLQGDLVVVRRLVGGLGVLLLLVKVTTILTPLAWGGHAQHGPIEISCLIVGVISILVASKRLWGDDVEEPGG